jgi:hypothetical protein
MAQADQTPSGPADSGDVAQELFAAVSKQLLRRGYFTTEWWTTIIGGALSTVLALVHVNGSSATHVVAVAAPALLAGLYAITRTLHKSALATALTELFPQATQPTGPGGQGSSTAQAGAPAAMPGGAAQSVVAPPSATPIAPAPPAAAAPSAALSGAAPPTTAEPTAAIAQTDADFEFRGIPPIEETDG